jgi:hypothetical protein
MGTPQMLEMADELPPIMAPHLIADPAAEDTNDQGVLPPFAGLPMEVVR